MIPISTACLGMGLILFGMSRILWLSLLLMLVCGFGMMQQMAASNTIIQTIVEDDKRGRVMSFYAMAFVGMAPFGSLLAGVLAHAIGAPCTVMLSGACCVAGAAWFATQVPSDPKIDSTHLCRSRHPAGGQRGDAGQRRRLEKTDNRPEA